MPLVALGAESKFTPLTGIPFLSNDGSATTEQYVNALYRLSISVAALLVVVKLIIAGFKYMVTEIVPAKEDAKKEIRQALFGLLIILAAVTILSTINPQLTDLKALENAPKVQTSQNQNNGGNNQKEKLILIPCNKPGAYYDCRNVITECGQKGGRVGQARNGSSVMECFIPIK